MQCPIWLFFVVPWFRAFPVRCSGVVWMTLRCFHLPSLLLVLLCFCILHGLISIRRSLYLIIIIIIIIINALKPLSRQSSINSSKADRRVLCFNYTSVAETDSAMESVDLRNFAWFKPLSAVACRRIYRIIIIVIIIIIINIVLIGVLFFSLLLYNYITHFKLRTKVCRGVI